MKFCFLIVVVLAYFVATVCCNDVDMKSIYKSIASEGEFDVSKLDSLTLTERQIDYAIEKAIEEVSVQDLDFLTNTILYATPSPSGAPAITSLKISLIFDGFKSEYSALEIGNDPESPEKVLLDTFSIEAMIGKDSVKAVTDASEYIEVTKAVYTEITAPALRGVVLAAGNKKTYSLTTTSEANYPSDYLGDIGESASSITQATIDNLQESKVSGSFNDNLKGAGNPLDEAEFVGFSVECVSNCGSSKKEAAGLSTGAIIGIAVGGAAFVGGVGAAVYFGSQAKGAPVAAYK